MRHNRVLHNSVDETDRGGPATAGAAVVDDDCAVIAGAVRRTTAKS